MSYPVFPAKLGLEAIVSPQAMLAHRRRGGRLPELEPIDAAILCLQRGLPERMRRQVRLRRVGRLMGELYLVRGVGRRVAVLTDFGLGAPIVAAQAEELIALGATRIVSVALAGGLQPDLGPGTIVVPDAALRDEGTSHHYLPPAEVVVADGALVNLLAIRIAERSVPPRRGRTWSTDAPYRETRDEVLHHQAAGVLTVDMEMAALLAVASARRVAGAGVLVAGDGLAGGVWSPPARLDDMERALELAYRCAVEVLSGP